MILVFLVYGVVYVNISFSNNRGKTSDTNKRAKNCLQAKYGICDLDQSHLALDA